jgi:hypothetical protein
VDVKAIDVEFSNDYYYAGVSKSMSLVKCPVVGSSEAVQQLWLAEIIAFIISAVYVATRATSSALR